MGVAEHNKARELFLVAKEGVDASNDVGCWDFEDGEAELVVGHVDEGGKRAICQGVLDMLKTEGFAMTKGYHLHHGPLPKHTGHYRFDAPIGGMQEAFYLTLNAEDVGALCRKMSKHK